MPAGSQSPKRTSTCLRNGPVCGRASSSTDLLAFLKSFDNAASDDQLLNLSRAFVDTEGADFAIKALDDRPAHDTQRSKDLDGGVNDALRALRGAHLGHGGLDCNRVPLVSQRDDTLAQQCGGIDVGGHGSRLGLSQLKVSESLAEHPPRSSTAQTFFHGSAGTNTGAGGGT